MPNYLILAAAIFAEVVATSALKASDGFTRLAPLALVAIGYAIAFYCLSLTLKTIPVGIAYGVWSGAGIVLISAIGWVLYGQKLDLPAVVGLVLIVAGVLVVNLLSKPPRTDGCRILSFLPVPIVTRASERDGGEIEVVSQFEIRGR